MRSIEEYQFQIDCGVLFVLIYFSVYALNRISVKFKKLPELVFKRKRIKTLVKATSTCQRNLSVLVFGKEVRMRIRIVWRVGDSQRSISMSRLRSKIHE